MKKHELSDEMATSLLVKLTQDTVNGNITWMRRPVNDDVDVPAGSEIPLTTAHEDYHFAAEIAEGVEAHFQHFKSLYFVWVVDSNQEVARCPKELYKMPSFVNRIVELSRAVRKVTHDDASILNEIGSYLNK